MPRTAFALLLLLMLVSCYRGPADISGWEYGSEDRDSLSFLEKHHYGINFNFVVRADSLVLVRDSLERDVVTTDSMRVFHGDLLVVADVMGNPSPEGDTILVKVAHDQYTIGWIGESELLANAVPDDPISQFIDSFSRINHVIALVAVVLSVLVYVVRLSLRKSLPMVYLNDISSPYPMLFCMMVSITAYFYGMIQYKAPHMWADFYFHPSLNPFSLPFLTGCFVACVWILLLLAIAVIEEVLSKLRITRAAVYLVGLFAASLVIYMVFTVLSPYCLVLLVVFLFISVRLLLRNRVYRCGRCGALLSAKSTRCPSCGARNS